MTVQTIKAQRVWAVTSETAAGALYRVVCNDGVWTCDCNDHYYRGHECKHIREVKAQQSPRAVERDEPTDLELAYGITPQRTRSPRRTTVSDEARAAMLASLMGKPVELSGNRVAAGGFLLNLPE